MLKKLFGCKEKVVEEPIVAREPTYTIGWEIYTKDGTIQTRKYDNVSNAERKSVSIIIDEETKEMHKALNKAAKEETEFVNLQGNIVRLNDVLRISIVNKLTGE